LGVGDHTPILDMITVPAAELAEQFDKMRNGGKNMCVCQPPTSIRENTFISSRRKSHSSKAQSHIISRDDDCVPNVQASKPQAMHSAYRPMALFGAMRLNGEQVIWLYSMELSLSISEE
jgi:hypothetical protein